MFSKSEIYSMKKYLLGLLAIVMAVGFSAFTNPKAEEKEKSNIVLRYWMSTSAIHLGDYVGDYTKDSQALEDATCLNNGTIQCARGYNPQSFNEENPPVGAQIESARQDLRKHQ